MECRQINFSTLRMKHIMIFMSFFLVACTGGPHIELLNKQPKKVAGTSDAAVMAWQSKLAKMDVKVITEGEDYLVSIPSDALFPQQSPQLTWQSYHVLNEVVFFLKQFRKVAVNVTSYSNKYVSTRREEALTLARAKSVSNYLWSQGIDSRFIFAEGAGSNKPIVASAVGGDDSVNSRIEITFRDAII